MKAAKKASIPRAAAKRQRLFKVLAVLLPVLLLLGVEGLLRLCGYGYSTTFFTRSADGQAVAPNWDFCRQFFSAESGIYPHPCQFARVKEKGTVRIFVLGESAAQGTPDPSFGFARILEVMLEQQFPGKKYEVINAAVRGVDSHIIRLIAQDCARYEPDVFLVYMGNNDAIGLHSPDPDSWRMALPIGVLRTLQSVRSSRIGQWLNGILSKGKKEEQDMELFRKARMRADDPRRERIYKYFRQNLEDICRAGQGVGAKVLVSTVAVNLKDFPPLGSLHDAHVFTAKMPSDAAARAREWNSYYEKGVAAESAGQTEQALAAYEGLPLKEDHFAEMHFRMARLYLASGNAEKALEHFRLARDWDALQFRTDERLNAIVREIALLAEGHLVDAEKRFAESPLSEQGIPGKGLFNDHVHCNFDGDYLLARTFAAEIVSTLGLQQQATGAMPTRAECAQALAFTAWDELNVKGAMVELTSKPPFLDQLDHAQRQAAAEREVQEGTAQFGPEKIKQALEVYRAALARRPKDWQLHNNLAGFSMDLKSYAAAVEEYKAASKLLPEARNVLLALGNAYYLAGKKDEARAQLEAVLRVDPRFWPAREALEKLK